MEKPCWSLVALLCFINLVQYALSASAPITRHLEKGPPPEPPDKPSLSRDVPYPIKNQRPRSIPSSRELQGGDSIYQYEYLTDPAAIQNDGFGMGVTISGDGNVVAVGAWSAMDQQVTQKPPSHPKLCHFMLCCSLYLSHLEQHLRHVALPFHNPSHVNAMS